ncbi:hypothetical protein [Persephonella sp.]|uniref:hypothetical protein n=1 Tax=Persephonella sp. TaxID=2060922 RepID=UPI002620CD48|nr:hypothetical protein [Persephonella sp.]
MKDKLFFVLYLLGIIALTSVHNLWFFVVFLSFLFVFSGKDIFSILKKTAFSIILFNSIVSISYIIYSVLKNQEWFEYIILLNLRVFTITFMTFLFIQKINIFKALSFSKTLQFLVVLSYSQILIYKKSFNEFKLALKSRIIQKPERKDMYNFISRVSYFFLNKSINNSKEISQAMKSRGFFID